MLSRKVRVKMMRVSLFSLYPLALISGHNFGSPTFLSELPQWMGYAFVFFGVLIRLWSQLHISESKSKRLIDEGPFSVCRNPLYVGSILIAIGVSLSFNNLYVGLLVLAVVIPMHIYVILAEEQHLSEIFGQEYAEYCRTTPRLLPNLWKYRKAESVTVSRKILSHSIQESMGFLMIPLVAQITTSMQQLGYIPILLQAPPLMPH